MADFPYVPALTKVATGNIYASTFVIPDTSTVRGATAAGANAANVLGVSQVEVGITPNLIESIGGPTTTAYAAIATQTFGVYTPGSIAPVLIGTGGVTNGDKVEVGLYTGGSYTAAPAAVTSTVSGHFVVGEAIETAAAGTIGHVLLCVPFPHA